MNLASADLLKDGGHFDHPIALGLLVAAMDGYAALGQLAIDGALAPVTSA